MIVYRIYCGSFEGSATYTRHDEAENAARFRTYCTGHEWNVKEVILP